MADLIQFEHDRGENPPAPPQPCDIEASDAKVLRFPKTPYAITPNIFMTLPPELRNMIYEYALPLPEPRHYIFDLCHPNSWEPGLLRAASPQMRREVLPIFWSRNGFEIHLILDADPLIMRKVVESLHEVTNICGRAVLDSSLFLLSVASKGSLSWSNLGELINFIRQTGLVLGNKDRHVYMQLLPAQVKSDLEDSMALGILAHEMKWTEAMFKSQIDKWSMELVAENLRSRLAQSRKESEDEKCLLARSKEELWKMDRGRPYEQAGMLPLESTSMDRTRLMLLAIRAYFDRPKEGALKSQQMFRYY